jgi:hypothetical protein
MTKARDTTARTHPAKSGQVGMGQVGTSRDCDTLRGRVYLCCVSRRSGGSIVAQPIVEARNEAVKKEWRRPVLRKLPMAETATKGKGNEGVGGGKGENVVLS